VECRRAREVVESSYRTGPGSGGANCDVSPDGQRFLVIKGLGPDQTATLPQLVVVQHWFDELKLLVPTK